MVPVKILCGACGAEVSLQTRTCPQCGADIEVPGGTGAPVGTGTPCPSCGHRNANPGDFCESCGGRLAAQSSRGKTSGSGRGKGRNRKAGSGWDRRKLLRNLPIAALILVLAGWLVYSELSREAPKEHVHENQAQPAGNATREIEQLQHEVDANPNDHGKLLQLANLLHDQSLSGDLRLLPRAIDAYKSYLSKHPEEGNPRVDLGICYFEWAKVDTANAAGLIHMAIQEMTTVFEANPRHQAAAFNLGIVTLSSGQSLLSNEWFKRAVDIDPESELGKRARNIMEQHTFSE